MKRYGYELEFISEIKRDGSGVDMLNDKNITYAKKEIFKLQCLSLTKKTYIASNMNSFVVRLKGESNESI